MDDGLFVVVFVRRSSASPDGAADAIFPEVVFITFLDAATAAAIQNCAELCITFSFAACCCTAGASSPTRSAWSVSSSLVRRSMLPVAFGAHVAFNKHEVNGSIGGEALPRPISYTSAVDVLTGVEVVSAVCVSCVACCVWCCDCSVVKPTGAFSPSKMGSALSHEWALDDVLSKIVVVVGSCPSSVSGPKRATGDV